MRPNLYQLKYGLVVTITLEFLDKYGMQLRNYCDDDMVTTKTSTLLESL
jgi:hypothetical protein